MALTGKVGAGNNGNVRSSISIKISGANASGAVQKFTVTRSKQSTSTIAVGVVGSQNESIIKSLVGVDLLTIPGNVEYSRTIEINGTNAQSITGNLVSDNPLPIVDIDTHDGDKLKDRFAREKAVREERRREVLALYERIVEGKEDIPEVVEPLNYITKQQILTSNLNFDKLIADLKNAEQIWHQHVENDDEEILLLL